ncbi:MAG: helix-turn-helix domain-containing protein [Gammaproteobacteria bacterium]|nr:helix-turn-helix domain-containing protein [Gammaproteobacteria bacterium]NIP89569.1 helix-turn-helix domain-containing protein [Gammaproteobacteria bacterium]NIR24403.1 helix-turn-helix domain-containing protein [Gammaproteobacteria bacterium]NIS06072.1 helix-turn-helix domain-containing protein [Gammaproteobacteria bacterium]NIU41310.1 helix-turn-helix domain-containing protein [Gammaproteobacteria bacterium]
MTVREVALYLNVNEKTVYRLAQRNELPGFKVAGAWRFRPEDIRRWVEGQKSRAPATPSKPRMEDEDKQKRKQR